MDNSEKILRLRKLTGLSTDDAEEYLEEHDWDLNSAIEAYKGGGKKKKPKDKKIFKVGDIVVCVDPKPGKLPPDCVDFLMTYKKFKVLDVNEKYNINLGHKLAENDNPYYFSPNRFELINGAAPIMKPGGTIVESGKETLESSTSASKSSTQSLPGPSKMDILRKKMESDAKKIRSFDDYGGGLYSD